jgi:PAS domain S-box-containing protein
METVGSDDAALHARRDELLRECDELESDLDKYRDLYNFAPDMYGLLDVNTLRILECNQAMVRMFGYERHEIVGRSLLDFHPSGNHEQLAQIIDRFRETGESPDAELEYLHKDGTPRLASSKVSAIRDETGRIIRARSVLRDITEYKQIELALSQSEERFRLLAETIDIVPWEAQFDAEQSTNLDSQDDPYQNFSLTYVGPQCEHVLGYTLEQYLRPGFWIEVIHPDDRTHVLGRLREFIARGDTESIEYRIIAGNGRTLWILNQCNIVRQQAGPSYMTGVNIDITDHKLASNRRRRVMQELDHRVKNTLTTVVAIADRTGETATSFPSYSSLLSSRVGALAQIHAALSSHDWLGLDMDVLVRAACGSEPRLQVAGPSIPVPLEIAQPLGMALHELVTNARAHGALSAQSGTVELRWTTEQEGVAHLLKIEWCETGGPPVQATQKRGCGRYLIEDVLAYEIDAEVELSFPASGLRCTMAIPLPRP